MKLQKRRSSLVSACALSACALTLLAGCDALLGNEGRPDGSEDSDLSRDGDPDSESTTTGDYAPGLAPTPLARLTNAEFIASAAALLQISTEAAPLVAARTSLVAEPLIGGLNNDAKTQLMKQLTLASFSTVASAVVDAFLEGVASPEDLAARLGCAAGADDLSACTEEFGVELMSRAYRRAPTSAEAESLQALVERLDALYAEESEAPDALDVQILRVRTVVRYILISPDYLLLVEKGTTDAPEDTSSSRPLNSHEIATRMAYFLTGSLPDAELMAAAEAGTLTDESIRLEHADRILDESDGEQKVRSALLGWLGVTESAVDAQDYAALSEFIGGWFSEEQPFADFYQAPVDVAHLDGSSSEQPFGVLGQRAFLDSHTSHPTAAFITRGVFLVERLLCLTLPADLPAEALEAGAQTDLEVFEVHDQQPCASCHQYFDNFGAALHQFDGETGLFVPGATELGTGFELRDPDGVLGVVDDPSGLGEVIATSERGQSCMTALWYRSAKRRDLDPGGADSGNVQKLMSDWNDSGDTSLKSLLRIIIASEDFVTLFP